MKLLRYSKYDILIYMTLDIEIGLLETFIAISLYNIDSWYITSTSQNTGVNLISRLGIGYV